jgi:dihydrofolate synthase/folylpolyglutamate synthase
VPVTLTRPSGREDLDRFLFDELTRIEPLRGEAGLAHARRFARLLGDPQDHVRQVHLVGTAGKGTSAVALTNLAVGSGLSVTTHMSPHVYDVRERFLLDGSLAPWPEILDAAEEIFHAAIRLQDESGRPPSFFAAAVGVAWVLGRRAGVDLMITEAGIGGKLDATNVIGRTDKITVVTNIGLDHADVLGPDVVSIAGQKAEVIPPGGLVVVGPQSHRAAVDVVSAVADERGARLVVVDQRIRDWRRAASVVAETVGAELGLDGGPDPAPYRLPPGRAETWQMGGRRIVLDGAHNPLKLGALFSTLGLGDPRGPAGPVVVIAIGAGKDLAGCADIIARHSSRAVVTAFGASSDPGAHPRSWPASELAGALGDRGVDVVGVDPEPATAVDIAIASSPPERPIAVTGSFFHLAAVRDRLLELGADRSEDGSGSRGT